MEFLVSRQVRDRFQFDQSLFSLDGNVLFANFNASRLFANKINQQLDLVNFPERAVKAGQINAMGLLDEILHHIIELYRRQKNPHAMQDALAWLQNHLGSASIERLLVDILTHFPPIAVYRRELSLEDYLDSETDGISNRLAALEYLLLLWVANKNPALEPYRFLFPDDELAASAVYTRSIEELHAFFETQPVFGPDQQNLIDMLRSPAIAVPHSLYGQLEYIRTRWLELFEGFRYPLLSSLDLIREEEKIAIFAPGVVGIPIYDSAGDQERFSSDREWMPHLVLIAKNTHVWLDQLAKKYRRSITRLDQVPDEELDTLAQWGINGLWLIGLWERSQASARIKQMMGNPAAIASAYSLRSYHIAADLGGEEAYHSLRERAWVRGIRLVSDMVPNHMGIDSEWVIDHPEWFLSLGHSPFPSYTFDGADLSPDPRVGIYLEDHYYTRSDTAVVFKRVDNVLGGERYIYHGNDGTSMPWNDTAQLNYLNPEVREAVIQTILDVARKFPIIRFDAAMTLARQHYHRLWFPEPGSGSDIPSRAGQGMTRSQFDALLPVEFWREVVDRVAAEAPDTLLLAEAFWLMEGYFVRTLGMHRVYNSAFMNLLRDEDNAKYRLVMKTTLEFDPEILKRFVNFMNNPDERTAVDQFGKGDKYLGICTLLSTLPGLPMFGHGQIEGFAEKYGMEFYRANWDEQPDADLVERHRRHIFPLLHRRQLFSGVERFRLYDFFTADGNVDENVFAFSNGLGGERALVVYHNRYGDTRGWIRTSVSYSQGGGDQRRLTQSSLAEGLDLSDADNTYIIFREHITGLEYLRPTRLLREQGLYLELGAYTCQVYLDFRQVQDDAGGTYRKLYQFLNMRGVPSITEALRELLEQRVQNPLLEIINPGYFQFLLSSRLREPQTRLPDHLLPEEAEKMRRLLAGIQQQTGCAENWETILTGLETQLQAALTLPILGVLLKPPVSKPVKAAARALTTFLSHDSNRWLVLFAWVFLHNLGKAAAAQDFERQTLIWLDEWQFGSAYAKLCQRLGLEETQTGQLTAALRVLISQQDWRRRLRGLSLRQMLEHWLSDTEVQRFLQINRFDDALWFNHEAFVEFTGWLAVASALDLPTHAGIQTAGYGDQLKVTRAIVQKLLAAEQTSGYLVSRLLAATEDQTD